MKVVLIINMLTKEQICEWECWCNEGNEKKENIIWWMKWSSKIEGKQLL